ncbi:uncharacterized protein TNCV_3658591 [Trichonephila clavipes]|nr:uncharacterized protein TNCV_3658591 [Trichonephila clavipes]
MDDLEDPIEAYKQEIGVYSARIRKIVHQLKDTGRPVVEWYQTFLIIRFLPTEFSEVVQNIYRWKDPDFTFYKILKELIAEESRLKQSTKDQHEALPSKQKEIRNSQERNLNRHQTRTLEERETM